MRRKLTKKYWIPRITSTISWTHKTNHTKRNKRRNRTLKYEKSTWYVLNNSRNVKWITQEAIVLLSYLFNVIIRRQLLHKLKLSEIILIPRVRWRSKGSNILSPYKLITHYCKITRKTDPPQNLSRFLNQRLDTPPPVLNSNSPLHNPAVPPYNSHHPQGLK
jgi:hypothetical protein